MARARVEADEAFFWRKLFVIPLFFLPLTTFCIVDEKRQELLGLRDLFPLKIGSSPESDVVISSLVIIRLDKAKSRC